MNWYKKAQQNIEEHLKNRGLNSQKTKVFIDKETNTATFPIYNLSGQLIGYQQYNPTGSKKLNNKNTAKYWTYITPSQKTMAVWGVETIKPTDKIIFIVEGIFDAIKIHNMGLPALAVLTNNPHDALKGWTKMLNKKIIDIIDKDKAGYKLKTIANISYTVPDPYKDLGEMPQEKVNIFIHNILNRI